MANQITESSLRSRAVQVAMTLYREYVIEDEQILFKERSGLRVWRRVPLAAFVDGERRGETVPMAYGDGG